MALASETPTLAGVLQEAIEGLRGQIHTALPGEIVAYSAATQKADVQPLIMKKGMDGVALPLPVIPGVPVQFPRGGGAFISFPLKPKDHCSIFFSERALDRWKTTGAITDPMDARKHDLSDAFVMPGLYPFGKSLTNAHALNLVIGLESGVAEIHVTPVGVVNVKAPSIALGSETAVDFVAMNALVIAELNALKALYNAHTHIETAVPGSPTAPPLPPMLPSVTVASTKVRAE